VYTCSPAILVADAPSAMAFAEPHHLSIIETSGQLVGLGGQPWMYSTGSHVGRLDTHGWHTRTGLRASGLSETAFSDHLDTGLLGAKPHKVFTLNPAQVFALENRDDQAERHGAKSP
jgi:hypothetical protein